MRFGWITSVIVFFAGRGFYFLRILRCRLVPFCGQVNSYGAVRFTVHTTCGAVHTAPLEKAALLNALVILSHDLLWVQARAVIAAYQVLRKRTQIDVEGANITRKTS